MTTVGFYFDGNYLTGNQRRFWINADDELFFSIEPVIRISHLIFNPDDTPETLGGIAMVVFNRTEGFCPDSISLNYGEVFHIHGFVAVDKTDGERYCVDGAS